MTRRSLGFCLLLPLLFGSIWLARDLLHGSGSSSSEAERAFAQRIVRSMESPLLAPWFDRLTALLQDHPSVLRYVVARPGVSNAESPELMAAGHTLTFPHFANGTGAGLKIQASVVLINNGGATATGTIYLWRYDGEAMSIGTSLGTGSTFNFTLTAGQTLRLDTNGTGDLVVGWVEVKSDVQISGAARFTTYDSAGHFLSEVGIGDSVRATKLMILIDTTSGKNSGFAVCNPNASGTASLTLNLRRMNGTSVATKTASLAARRQSPQFVGDVFGATAQNFKGVLVISSNGPLISLVTLRTQGLNYTSLPAVPEATDDSEDLLFARTGDGMFGAIKLRTSFFLMNNSATAVNATLRSYSASGGALALKINGVRDDQFNVSVPAGGAVALESDGTTNPPDVGWAIVTSDAPLAGGAAFTLTQGATLLAEVGVPASPSTPTPAIYVQEQGGSSTAFGLTNPQDLPVTVRLRLTGRAGASPEIQAEKLLDMAPLSHTALYVPQLFPGVPAVTGGNFTGRLEAEAWFTEFGEDYPSEVTGLTLLSHGTYLTSAPIADFVVNFGPRMAVRPASLLEGSSPAFRMKLTQMAGEIPLWKGTLTLDKGTINLTKFQTSDSVGELSTSILVYLLMGKCLTADATASSAVFYSPLTIDGISDWEPFFVKASNVTGGGVKFELTGQSKGEPQVGMTFLGLFDLISELVRLPSGATTVTVTETYESDPLPSGTTLKCSRVRTLTTAALASGAPRIDSVTPSTVVGGQQVTIKGANFSATPSANSVTVEGNSRVAATVLQASSTSLLVQLPPNIRTGALHIRTGTKDSNDYAMRVLFAPVPSLTIANRAHGAPTGVKLEVGALFGQMAFEEIVVDPSEGEWITSGFTAGAKIGTAGFASPTDYDLKVSSSGADQLVVNVIEPGETDPTYVITVCKSCADGFIMRPAEGSFSYVMPQDGSFVINFTSSVFRNPATAARVVTFNTRIYSVPKRTMIPATRLSVDRQLTYTTQ